MENKILEAIRDINTERVKKEIENSNGFLNSDDIKTVRISRREIFERLNTNLESIFEPLDNLMYDGYIVDHSTTTISWGRTRGADGSITNSIGHYVELCV